MDTCRKACGWPMPDPVSISVSATHAPGLAEQLPHSPRPRRGVVARTALVGRLRTTDAPVVTVVAPAGFGKTTLLAQWAERDPRPCAWLSLESIREQRWPRRPALLVVDDADVLRDDVALDAVAALAEGVPAGSTLAL